MRMSQTLLAIACSTSFSLFAAEDVPKLPTDVIVVEAEGPLEASPGADVLPPGTPHADPGAELRRIPGVDGIRMGGHGVDPVLRGQQREAIRVTIDGAETVGGCPNRMDPPASFATLAFYDKIIIKKGRHSLSDGSSGPAGHISFERFTEPLNKGQRARARFQSGYSGNAPTWLGAADITIGEGPWYARFQGAVADADDYEDGDGNTVASSFSKTDGAIIVGFQGENDLFVEVIGELGSIDDARFAGAPMDAPLTERSRIGGRFEWRPHRSAQATGYLRAVGGDLNYTQVDHTMDNHTLRLRTAGMPLRTESETSALGGRLELEVGEDDLYVNVGVDHRDVHQDARRYGPANKAVNPALGALKSATGLSDLEVHKYLGVSTFDDGNVDALQSVMWPDVDTRNTGLFAELTVKPLPWATVIAGVRIDSWSQQARAADMPVDPRDPLSMAQASYVTYYGSPLGDADRYGLGALLRIEGSHMGDDFKWYAGLSRTVRQPDASERTMFATLPMMMAANRWMGNPALEPEVHHQLDVGVVYDEDLFSLAVDGFYDDIQNKIIRERAHSPWGATANVLNADPMVPMSVNRVLNAWTLSFVPDANLGDYLIRQNLAPQVAAAWTGAGQAGIFAEAALREVWRGRDVTLAYDRARIYRNVDAALTGVEISASANPLDGLSLNGGAAYTHGTNRDDDKPLAQIPPLSGSFQIKYSWHSMALGLRAEGQLRQTRIDGTTWNASGDDTGQTPSWGVVDFHGSWQVFDTLELRGGVDNIFDRTYARHLNRANSIDADALRVNEPGRSFWLQAQAEF